LTAKVKGEKNGKKKFQVWNVGNGACLVDNGSGRLQHNAAFGAGIAGQAKRGGLFLWLQKR
jgi:hypothetical protein